MQVFKITTTGVVISSKMIVEGATLIPGSDAATLVLNDSDDGSGDDKGEIKTDNTYSSETSLYGQVFKDGVYATLTGTGAVAYIYIR